MQTISSHNPVRIISRWLTSPLPNTIAFFGGVLNLNVHFHMPLLDGVYDVREENKLRLHRTRAPTSAQLMRLAATIARRVCRHLEKRGYLPERRLLRRRESAKNQNQAGCERGFAGLGLAWWREGANRRVSRGHGKGGLNNRAAFRPLHGVPCARAQRLCGHGVSGRLREKGG